jgi:hypothetical protein
VNQANQWQDHILYTGIGAGACVRHGCYVPACVVNFTKGEKQVVLFIALSAADLPIDR